MTDQQQPPSGQEATELQTNIGVTARVTLELSLTGGRIPERLLPLIEELRDLGVQVEIRGPAPADVAMALDDLESRLPIARDRFKTATAEIAELQQRIDEARSINRFLQARDARDF